MCAMQEKWLETCGLYLVALSSVSFLYQKATGAAA
jgi:hypothetical protein